MRKTALLFSLLLLMIPVPWAAADETAAATDEAATDASLDAKVRKLLDLTASGELGTQVVQQMIGSFRQSMPEVPAEFWDEFSSEIDPDGLEELVIPVYKKHFTEEEIDGMIEFYESDLGRSVIAKLPVVMQESMMAGQSWGEQLAREALERLKEKGYDVE